ncbi:MAG: hypothetical protein SGJ00_02480 [bacterium]|nr:hypothetical protein [bacterium]
MTKNTNNWIEEVLDSTKFIERAEAPSSLDAKVWSKINSRKSEGKIISLKKNQLILAAAAILFWVSINFLVMLSHTQKKSEMAKGSFKSDYGFTSENIINL